MSWWTLLAAIGLLLLVKLLMLWRNPRPHLLNSWSGFDLFVRSLVLERKEGSSLSIRHKDSDRAIMIEKPSGWDDDPGLRLVVPQSSSAHTYGARLVTSLSDVVSTSERESPEILLSVEIHDTGETLVQQTVRLAHRCFLAMGVETDGHFKMSMTGEYNPEYFRNASEGFLDHDSSAVRAAFGLSNALSKRYIRKQQMRAKKRDP